MYRLQFQVLALSYAVALASASEAAEPACQAEAPLSLDDLVERFVSGGQASVVSARALGASRAHAMAEQEAHWPTFEARLDMDAGRRARPGEERELGPAVRGVGSVELRWSAFEDARQARLAHRASAVSASDATYRAVLEQRRRDGVLAILAWQASQVSFLASREALDAIAADAERIEHRVRVGLADSAVGEALSQERARIEARSLAHAAHRDRIEAELARAASLCAADALEGLRGALIENDVLPVASGPYAFSEVHEAQAEVTRLEAEVLQREGSLQMDLFGRMALHGSQAFGPGVEEEWVMGAVVVWRPDFFGVRTRQADALRSDASVHEARAALVQEQLRDQVEALRSDARELRQRMELRTLRRSRTEASSHRMIRRVEEGLAPPEVLVPVWAQARLDGLEAEEDALALRLVEAELAALQHLLWRAVTP